MEPQTLPGTIHGREKDKCLRHYNKRCCSNRRDNDDELIVLRALYLSQKRAEEAEKKIHIANEEKEQMAKLILQISASIQAHENWERIIEIDSALLKKRLNLKRTSRDENRDEVAMLSWELGLALLGFAGAGFVLGRNFAFKL